MSTVDPLRATIGDHDLTYRIVGSGTMRLVFLHEGLGSMEMWRGFDETVATVCGEAALVYDRRGHGRSDPAVDERGLDYLHVEAFVELPALLDHVHVEDPILIGHSDGASIALLHAARYPVAGVVAIAPHVFVERKALEGIAETDARARTGDLVPRLERYHDDAASLFQAWRDIWLSEGFRAWNIESDLASVTAPVLLVQGADDEYGTLEQLDRVEAAVSGPVERFALEPAGHSPHLTRPDEVRDRIASFVEGIRGG